MRPRPFPASTPEKFPTEAGKAGKAGKLCVSFEPARVRWLPSLEKPCFGTLGSFRSSPLARAGLPSLHPLPASVPRKVSRGGWEGWETRARPFPASAPEEFPAEAGKAGKAGKVRVPLEPARARGLPSLETSCFGASGAFPSSPLAREGFPAPARPFPASTPRKFPAEAGKAGKAGKRAAGAGRSPFPASTPRKFPAEAGKPHPPGPFPAEVGPAAPDRLSWETGTGARHASLCRALPRAAGRPEVSPGIRRPSGPRRAGSDSLGRWGLLGRWRLLLLFTRAP
jgi:hypothetical protein